MKKIEMSTWNRRKQFEFFSAMENPQCGLTCEIDITNALNFMKLKKISSYIGMIYLVSKAANLIPELRQRNIGNDVYEYEVVHPSFTLLTDENQLNFCCSEFTPDAPTFINKTSELVVAAKAANEFHLDPPRHDLLFITCLPWIHFTALSHPVPHPATDSFPRIGWGRYTECGTKTTISLNIQVNHGLVDGYHISQFINGLEEYCSNPVTAFEGGLGEGAETTKDFLVL